MSEVPLYPRSGPEASYSGVPVGVGFRYYHTASTSSLIRGPNSIPDPGPRLQSFLKLDPDIPMVAKLPLRVGFRYYHTANFTLVF